MSDDTAARGKADRSRFQDDVLFRQLADAMPLIVWTADVEGQLDFANKALSEYAGRGLAELAEVGWRGLVDEQDLHHALPEWERCVRSGRAFFTEVRLRRAADGAFRWHQMQAVAARGESGEVSRWYGTLTDVHDGKATSEEHRRLAHDLSATLESIPDGLLTVDRQWRVRYVNGEAGRLLGIAREGPSDRELWAEQPRFAGSPLGVLLRRAMDEGAPLEFEERLEPGGRWLGGRAHPSAHALNVYVRDVTERREARERLRLSEERFRLLSKATNDAIWDWDLSSDSLWWNEGVESLFGYSREELLPHIDWWASRIHWEDRERVLADRRRAIEGAGDAWAGEYRFRRRDGSYGWVLDRGHLTRDEGGRGVRMIGGMTDLTARRLAEDRLREHATLLDKAQDAIIVRDLEHRVQYWNQSAERLYEWTAAEVLGRSIPSLIYKEPREFFQGHEATLETGEWLGEVEQVTKSGKALVVEGRWTLVRDEQGGPKSVLAINTDITERKAIEQQLLRAQRLESIGTLAGGIAHDLNNMLTPILMSVASLRLGESDSERLEDLRTMEECAERGAEMIRQLLSFARGAGGQRRDLDVGQLVSELQRFVKDTFPKDIVFTAIVPEDTWTIFGDPTQLNQLLINLCVNARDAMREGGYLTVAVENVPVDEVYANMNLDAVAGPYVVIRTEDTGSGMTPETLERIFEPFFTTKKVGEGTGLGLSTTHAIVKAHGGFINVYSELGKGTKFKIYLPAGVSRAETERAAVERTLLPRGSGELILVVDDEEAIRAVTQRTLERFGYRVLSAANGAEAVSLYAQRRDEVAAVLTDMAMPIMDGPALIVALKSMNPAVRVIGSSGLSANGAVAKAASAGVRHFVPKPYTAETMLRTIRLVLTED